MKSPATLSGIMVYGVLCGALCGCGTSIGRDTLFGGAERPAEPQAALGAEIAADPAAFLRSTLQRCRDQEVYEVEFRRQERRGTLFGTRLADPEHMHVKYQARPLSIRMDMQPPSTFSSVAYVEGRNNNKLRCKWRKALLPGAEPPVNDYDPTSAVKFGFSRSPVTDFGVARLMELVVATVERMTAAGMAPEVTYHGVAALENEQLSGHHIELRYAPETELERLKVDLLIHADSRMPAACYLWLANGDLDAMYQYSDFNLQPAFSEQDFEIE